ncbi:NAD(P)-dependent oxidoreductase [Chrysiogenes arsenatis]|uniref:NAD(P)-dependent oxidoreductase n=1 Tax=Chrysiogenes arsenatis TaxID=309797 RepID=UPI000422BE26|nr:NAD(P)-dependent oxidoreductase [Chrysiogenes arsenatis]
MNIVVCDRLEAPAEKVLQQSGHTIVLLDSPSEEEIRQHLCQAEAIIVRSHTTISAALIAAAPALKVIGRAGVGSYNIDVEAASKAGVVVLHSPDISSTAAAELGLCLIIAAARRLWEASLDLQNGVWDRARLVGTELGGKTLGIVGYGNVGHKLAAYATALNMDVIACDPYVRNSGDAIALLPFQDLLERSDVVVAACARTPETEGMFHADVFAQMKKGAIFVNIANGKLVVEDDLIAALDTGQLTAAAVDVYQNEPAGAENRAVQHPKIFTTPHIGAATTKAQEGVCVDIVSKVLNYLQSGYVAGSINLPVIAESNEVNIAGYLDLAGKLASILAQLDRKTKNFTIELNGKIADITTNAIENGAIKSFLKAMKVSDVNDINAPFLLADQGVAFTTSRGDAGGSFVNELVMSTDNASITGTLLADKFPRIVEVNGYRIEAVPAGIILFFRNYNRPGVIGDIGTLLGQKGVNIANMKLGIRGADEALCMVNIDSPVSADVLAEIASLNNVIDCLQLELTDAASQ